MSRDDLVAHFESSITPQQERRIGVEHEKLLVDLRDEPTRGPLPVPFAGERGVQEILADLCDGEWRAVEENGHLVGVTDGQASHSIEPGGQLEYATRPVDKLRDLRSEVRRELGRVCDLAAERDLAVLLMGHPPTWSSEEVFWVPRSRYALMRAYMPRVGRHGLDMMGACCSVQLNFDYAGERDMVKKLRVAAALQPVVASLVACSPLWRGRPSGYRSFRGHVWSHTDPARCGLPDLFFEEGMGFERYVDFALDVPMYSVLRGETHLDLLGESFHAFLEGRLRGMPGCRPTLADWEAHLNTVMTEARLKRVIELRGADTGPLDDLFGLAALWTGLLYDDDVLDQAERWVLSWTSEERQWLWRRAPQAGLALPARGTTVAAMASEVLALARIGLQRSDQNREALDWIEPFERRVATRRCPAIDLVERWRHDGRGPASPLGPSYLAPPLPDSDLAAHRTEPIVARPLHG